MELAARPTGQVPSIWSIPPRQREERLTGPGEGLDLELWSSSCILYVYYIFMQLYAHNVSQCIYYIYAQYVLLKRGRHHAEEPKAMSTFRSLRGIISSLWLGIQASGQQVARKLFARFCRERCTSLGPGDKEFLLADWGSGSSFANFRMASTPPKKNKDNWTNGDVVRRVSKSSYIDDFLLLFTFVNCYVLGWLHFLQFHLGFDVIAEGCLPSGLAVEASGSVVFADAYVPEIDREIWGGWSSHSGIGDPHQILCPFRNANMTWPGTSTWEISKATPNWIV